MCGIVGYTGPREAGPILIEGLKRLEYRGYDSAGIALVDDAGALVLEKRAGKLANLQTAIADRTPHAAIGLAHTRWATHGRPNDLNAHPHQDCTGDLNVMHKKEISRLVGARQDVPLVVGRHGEESFIASDVAAILAHTNRIIFLEEGDVADVRPNSVVITDVAGAPQERAETLIYWTPEAAEKSGFDHFMLKEIHEQPTALRQCIAGRVTRDGHVRLAEIDG